MIDLERATAHGHARATQKDYWSKREREWSRRHMPTQTGKANHAGWQQLAAMFSDSAHLGYTVQRGGERLVQSVV